MVKNKTMRERIKTSVRGKMRGKEGDVFGGRKRMC